MDKENMTPAQAADSLGISAHTVKKYARLLELRGHNVARNGLNHRVFTDTDITLMKAMLLLNRDKSVHLEQAADIVTSADTDISKILVKYAPGSELHTIDSTDMAVQGILNKELLKQIFTQYQTDIMMLRDELETRDQQMLELQENINTQLIDQTNLIVELRKEVMELRKKTEEKPNPQKTLGLTLWTRLFRRND